VLADVTQPRDRRRRLSARDHVLALQMKGGIRLDIEPKMRQPLRSGASDAKRVEALDRLGRHPERWLGGGGGP